MNSWQIIAAVISCVGAFATIVGLCVRIISGVMSLQKLVDSKMDIEQHAQICKDRDEAFGKTLEDINQATTGLVEKLSNLDKQMAVITEKVNTMQLRRRHVKSVR